MGSPSPRRLRRLAAAAAAAALALPGTAAAAPPSISVSGNHFVNGSGQTVRLLGVDHPSFEYACVDGYAYDDGNMDAADAAAIASWHATAVRVPLNEDCWLGINGQPNSSQGADPPLTQAGYQQAVKDYVADLEAAGLYVILDLHWSAPGGHIADGQRPMPDDHSAAFWTSVASSFKDDHAVVFDVFNEPYSPDQVNDPAHSVSWDCWKSGGCTVPAGNDSDQPNGQTYTAVGMQALVTAIRSAGAQQPILLGGLSYANDLTGWLAHEPTDPAGQLAASFHNYNGEACDHQACWDSQIGPVAAAVPVVTGEFDQDCKSTTFDDAYMAWADRHGVGYLAWGWWVLSKQEINAAGCSAYYLITDASGTPAAGNGTLLHAHLAALAGAGATTAAPRLRGFADRLSRNHRAVVLTVAADETGSGAITASTPLGRRHHKREVGVGSVRFSLVAGKAELVDLKLSRAARALLARHRRLAVRLTITLTNAAHQRRTTHRELTLVLPARRR